MTFPSPLDPLRATKKTNDFTLKIQIVNQRKQDLERRLKSANNDKSNLSAALDESGDKILLLESLLSEKEGKLGSLLAELNEFRDSSSWLSNELESMISLNEKLLSSEPESEPQRTRLADLQSLSERKRSQLVEQLKQLQLRNCSRLKANEFMLLSRRARPESGRSEQTGRGRARRRRRETSASLLEEIESSNGSSNRSPAGSLQDAEAEAEEEAEEEDEEEDEWNERLAGEILSLLGRFRSDLQLRREAFAAQSSQHLYSPNSADDSGISADDSKLAANDEPPDCKANSNSPELSALTVDKSSSEQLQVQVRDGAAWRRLLNQLKSLIEEMVS